MRPINNMYPEHVANTLRRALYYSKYQPNMLKANAYYAKALNLAREENMDPLSDEVLGIYIRIAEFFSDFQEYDEAILVLESRFDTIMTWMNLYGSSPEFAAKRTRLLKKAASFKIELGKLYTNQYVNEQDKAETSLTQGVEILLGESLRRANEGVKPNEGVWASQEELGGSLESLAHFYEKESRHNLSAPLFLRAITLAPPPCHAAVLMNNLATSLAQTMSEQAVGAPTSRAALVANARSWAEKALSVAQGVKPPERTEECDMGCAVATHNLGEFAEMEGLVDEARKRYNEASSLARAIGFKQGVAQAKEGLQRLNKK